jgi:DNA-binding CsgD family transcriptional regulator
MQRKEIAALLKCSRPTVERYVRDLYNKFDARSPGHLIALALCYGKLSAEDIVRFAENRVS